MQNPQAVQGVQRLAGVRGSKSVGLLCAIQSRRRSVALIVTACCSSQQAGVSRKQRCGACTDRRGCRGAVREICQAVGNPIGLSSHLQGS